MVLIEETRTSIIEAKGSKLGSISNKSIRALETKSFLRTRRTTSAELAAISIDLSSPIARDPLCGVPAHVSRGINGSGVRSSLLQLSPSCITTHYRPDIGCHESARILAIRPASRCRRSLTITSLSLSLFFSPSLPRSLPPLYFWYSRDFWYSSRDRTTNRALISGGRDAGQKAGPGRDVYPRRRRARAGQDHNNRRTTSSVSERGRGKGVGAYARARALARIYEIRQVGRWEGAKGGIVGQAPSPSRRRTIGRPGGRDKSALLTIKRELRYARAAVLPSTGTSFAESLGSLLAPPTPNTPVTLWGSLSFGGPDASFHHPTASSSTACSPAPPSLPAVASSSDSSPRSPIRASGAGGSIPRPTPSHVLPFASLDYPYFPFPMRSHHAPVHARHPTSGAAAFETRSVTRMMIMLQTRRATAMHTR